MFLQGRGVVFLFFTSHKKITHSMLVYHASLPDHDVYPVLLYTALRGSHDRMVRMDKIRGPLLTILCFLKCFFFHGVNFYGLRHE